jgi:hypothetical protein
MRAFASALLALLLVPASAAGKEPDAPVRVLWNSTPDGVRAGGAWDARLSLLQGPGGFYGGRARPVIVVTKLATRAERRVPMVVDVAPNTFRARVPFPRVGRYVVAVAGFDPRDPERFVETGRPVLAKPAPPPTTAAGSGGAWWPWAVVVAALLASAWTIRRAGVPAR